MKHKNLMAKALYDNMPESPEELAFRKGDILTVIEQNTGGLEGWWLCSLHGRQGIAPGNRLKLLIGPMFDSQTPTQSPVQNPAMAGAGFGQKAVASSHGLYQVPAAHQGAHLQGIYQVPPAQDVYQVPQGNALAVDRAPTKVVTPTRVGNTYTYRATQQPQQDVYDVPPMRQQGVYDVPQGRQAGKSYGQGVYDIPPPSQSDPKHQGVYDVPPSSQGLYSVPPCRNNPVQDEGNYDFPQPHKPKQEGIYDIPPPSTQSKATQFPQSGSKTASHRRVAASDSNAIYDVPPSQLTSTSLPAVVGAQRDVYDIPRGMQTPPQRRVATLAEREQGANRGVYDVPQAPDVAQTPRGTLGDMTDGVNRLSFSSTGSTRSSMSTSSSSAGSPSEPRLALDLDSAVQRLGQLQQALESSSAALLALASSPHWRTFGFMERHANEARAALERVRATLAEFLAFGRGAACNATALSDPSLHSKLRRQLGRLEDSQLILQQTYQALEASGWAVHVLAGSAKHQGKSDDLDRFVMVSRTVPDDAKQLASTVGTNGELLFRRSTAPGEGTYYRGIGEESVGIVHPLTHNHTDDNYNEQTKPFPVPQEKANMNNSEKCVKSWMEDYDYVHLQGKEEFERQQKELLEKENITKQKVQLEQEQLNKLKQLEQEVIKPVENDISQWISTQQSTGSSSTPSDSSSSSSSSSSTGGGGTQLCGRDRQLLGFYAEQCEQHFVTLLNAIDAFFGCVAAGQPPRIFVAHSKFVILSAHKLVFIGDTLSRQASTPDVANRVMNSSNVLCDLLKTVVASTKMAALNYPNTPAVQEMVDRVAELSHEAQKFKTQLHQMAAL